MEKVVFCLNANFANLFRPIPPEPQLGVGQAAQIAHRREMIEYRARVTDYRNKYIIAWMILLQLAKSY